jgi:hypothetical protein
LCGGSLRRKDESLADELALGVLGDGDSITAGARGTTDKGALGGRGPASMADVGELDFAVVGVGGRTNEHTEALLECGCLAAGDVVDVKTTIVDKLALWSSVSDLRDTTALQVST